MLLNLLFQFSETISLSTTLETMLKSFRLSPLSWTFAVTASLLLAKQSGVRSEETFGDYAYLGEEGDELFGTNYTTDDIFDDLLGANFTTDDVFGFDDDYTDDTFLDEILTGMITSDEDFFQCSNDMEVFNAANSEIEQTVVDFSDSATVTPNFSMDLSETFMNVDFSQEARETLRQTCTDAGGYFDESSRIVCKMSDIDLGEVTINIASFANCVANTEACRNLDIMTFITGMLSFTEMECENPDEESRRSLRQHPNPVDSGEYTLSAKIQQALARPSGVRGSRNH